MNGICEMASSYDYDIIISMIDGADVSQIQRLEANRKVDGIIVSRAVVSSKVQKYLKNCKEPYILIGPSSDPEVPFVDNKNQEAGKELTSIMLMKGFRNLALLGGNQSTMLPEADIRVFWKHMRKWEFLLTKSNLHGYG